MLPSPFPVPPGSLPAPAPHLPAVGPRGWGQPPNHCTWEHLHPPRGTWVPGKGRRPPARRPSRPGGGGARGSPRPGPAAPGPSAPPGYRGSPGLAAQHPAGAAGELVGEREGGLHRYRGTPSPGRVICELLAGSRRLRSRARILPQCAALPGARQVPGGQRGGKRVCPPVLGTLLCPTPRSPRGRASLTPKPKG